MGSVEFSDLAERDLSEISAYIAMEDPRAARRLLVNIREKCLFLGERPLAGRRSDDLLPESRCFPAGKYLIFYEIHDDGIVVIRIVHGARDLRTIFPE
ncbi:MAG TPA: type II toxin-antitoxin system RelE/ParE family toxin [Azospirillum sp.]|nr:type II toxin-antitoxin system RelE/ParE family toxin [Azospirillum sp.]